ncbi:ubiquitin-related modifier [Saccharomycopsis crataegensis]|uniref:Ubiquitin-related modifier 1 n=1 Tax=Saccharomycopsis crataegensis TaxID=43959 RepID=A0AAV5QSB5_9ASCO|nr:ubiquitin-related modifier [Saccharomycopsis crataegensis]
MSLSVSAEFLGGLDQIFGKVRQSTLTVPEGSTIKDLLQLIVQQHLENPKDICMFLDDDNEGIRAGILVLINDVDWELEGELEYELEHKDVVTFTSTLHGG